MRLHSARPAAIIQGDTGNPAPDPEHFVAEFAQAFVRISPADVDSEIERWLSRLVLHVGADRSSVIKTLNKTEFFVSHTWARPGCKAIRRKGYDGAFPWSYAMLRQGSPVIFDSLEGLPDAATADHDDYEWSGVRSLLSVPLIAGGAVIGVFSVSTVRAPRTWSYEDITRVQLLGSVLASALARQESWLMQQCMEEQLMRLARISVAGELAASLAHELTQPLAAILANAQAGLRFLARQQDSGGDIAAILQDIVRDDKRAGAVISGLRAMMRKRQSEREWVDMSQLVQEILAMLNMNIQAQRVDVRTTLEPDCLVYVDRAQMQQVLINLIINALEAMQGTDEEDRRLFVEVRSDASVHCSVHDSGSQLTPEGLEKIFEPFWTTKTQGMGMGLPVCRSIIDAHHGSIWAEIDPQGGAIFRFNLPKETPHVDGSATKAD